MSNIPAVCEDTIHVLIFSPSLVDDIDAWKSLCENINMSLKVLSQEYIWHKNEFKVCLPVSEQTLDIPQHLVNSTCFGDNIEDEWFIVYLLLEISKQFKDVIIHATDSDGDFLLIEAAMFLPSWANPDSTDKRVYICNNKVHLIPPALAEIEAELTIKKALQLITKFPHETIASLEIQKAIQSRICQYPAKINENFHKALVQLPVEVATLLALKPSLISAIVEAYCSRDIIDDKYCRSLKYEDFILTEVKFTKCLYAMLVHSKLIRNINCELKTENNKRNVLGLKLLCGYHILMNRQTKDVFSTKEFMKFISNLEANGYFKGNLEGSRDYKELLEKAKQYYLDIECPTNEYMCYNILQLMSTNDFLTTKNHLNKDNSRKVFVEDSDEWLNIHPKQLNDLLTNRYGENVKFKNNEELVPETITTKLTDFLQQTSDFEGIEKNDLNEFNDCINFDSNEFVNCLEKMMKLCVSEKYDDFGSDESESDCDIPDTDKEVLTELNEKLHRAPTNNDDSKSVVFNLTQSIREEGLSGPSSNLLHTIGINKTDILDSDDDE